MRNRAQSSNLHIRHPFPSILLILIIVFVSIGCISDDFDCWLNPDNCAPVLPPSQSTQGGPVVEFYAGTGSADTIFTYSFGPPIKTNTCHDEISDAWVKIYHTQEVPADVGISQTLTTDQYYFTAEIHSALANPWRDKKCVYAENKNDYVLYMVNGIYDKVTFEFTPIYLYYGGINGNTGCDNAAKLEFAGGNNVRLTFDCVRETTTVHFSFDLPLQNSY